jgi:hypothetical protein
MRNAVSRLNCQVLHHGLQPRVGTPRATEERFSLACETIAVDRVRMGEMRLGDQATGEGSVARLDIQDVPVAVDTDDLVLDRCWGVLSVWKIHDQSQES